MIQAMKNLNLLQNNGTLETITAKDKYNQKNSIKFERESFCDYSDAFNLVAGNITVTVDNNADVAYKHFVRFSTCKTEIIDVFINKANHIYIAMPGFSLIKYSDNH